MNYIPKNHVRIVTAASLFDGHDATINIIRRLLQESGAEVIHLGHNRSVSDVVRAALEEGAQGICVSSYQGGHVEYFKYMKDLLSEAGAKDVRIFGGGGGVIIHEEKNELEAYGISQIFHPDDGRRLGLEGMIEQIIKECDFAIEVYPNMKSSWTRGQISSVPVFHLGRALSVIEKTSGDNAVGLTEPLLSQMGLSDFARKGKAPQVLGITGTGGAGKSSLIDEIIQRFLNFYPDKKVAVICVDPSKKKTGGALLGDRIRMNSLSRDRVYMRSLASRGSGSEVSVSLPKVLDFCKKLDFDLILAETSGIGQAGSAITQVSDLSMYVMTSDFGAPSQLEKIDMIDFADIVAVNKADRRGAHDALRAVSKQYRRSRKIFDDQISVPVFLTQASQFNDSGVNKLFFALGEVLEKKEPGASWIVPGDKRELVLSSEEQTIIPPERQGYLAEITQTIRGYKKKTHEDARKYSNLGALYRVKELVKLSNEDLEKEILKIENSLTPKELSEVRSFSELRNKYAQDKFQFSVRGKNFEQELVRTTLSGTKIKKVVVPDLTDWGDRHKYLRLENVPGEFPFTGGVFPLKRQDEDPKRMFAGEGTPERTNRRFHYLCEGESAHRLSTAFDSVTLYGQDPNERPDIFGKVGESGVSICTLEDMKKLYAGFDFVAPNTSVSMTINGPAPMMLAFYFNAAIDAEVAKKEKELGRKLSLTEHQQVFDCTLEQVRGTVQADILKEDQGQNTCLFSVQFALKMMGDIQEYFVKKGIKNFYSVSISGYHIAEAGANPISQLAFTLSNGFTLVEYYLSRGMKIDDFAPNLSFFFSNGLDAEYAVLGRVARRIWAVAMRDLYQASERSQKLKYHIQTSGRSLHAQEIDFNDIRTTLQALIAIYDNTNSLHTNAYDEAITTPTEESVRRAMAIQMIINKEFGLTMNENPTQGAYFIEELTDLVEESVLELFLRINERGGVLGAMETQFQRARIQDESLYYETLKHSGKLPIVGVNTFINPKTLAKDYIPPKIELARASFEEKSAQLKNVHAFQKKHQHESQNALNDLKNAVLAGENVFESLMVAARVCSLGQMSEALYEVGGQYRRNL